MTTHSVDMIKWLTCDQLRAECTRVNLPTTGLKKHLQERLLRYHEAQNSNGNSNSKADNKENNDPTPQPKPKKKCPSADLVCPITLELTWDPVTAEDGRVYERTAIEEHIANQGRHLKSPMTNAPMGPRLYPAPQHKNLIEALIDSGALSGDLVSKWNEKVNEKKVMEDLLKEAENGDVDAMRCVGLGYLLGRDGFKSDEKLAYSFFNKGHVAGNVTSSAMLGLCYFSGDGVEKCEMQAFMYLGIAAGKGSRVAALWLAAVLDEVYNLQEMPAKKEEAIRWLLIALEGNCDVEDMDAPLEMLPDAQELLDELTGENL